MGGGRDVDNAPHPSAYGFEESSVTFEDWGIGFSSIMTVFHNKVPVLNKGK